MERGELTGEAPVAAQGGVPEWSLYRAVLDELPDFTILVFDRQLRFVYVGGGGFRRTGWVAEDLLGRTPIELMGPAGAEVEDHMRAVLEGESRKTETPGLRDREVIWDNLVRPIRNKEGAVVGGVVISRDVGPVRLAEAGRRSMEELATAAAREADLERRARERLEFLAEINEVLAECTDRRDIMRAVVRSAVPRLGTWCTIYVFLDPQRHEPELELAHVDPAMEAFARELQERFPYDPAATWGVAYVIRSRRPVYFEDIGEETMAALELPEETRDVVRHLDLRSAVIVPLVKRHQVVGALEFFATGDRRYGPADLALAQAMAGRVASALDNRRLAEQQTEIARTLQRSLLPESLPDVPGVELAVRYWAAGEGTEVGGDFYDVFSLEGTEHALVIGDVCGNGPEAAAITALVRHTIRAAAWRGDDPAAVLANLDAALLRTLPDTFCTVAYATVRPAPADRAGVVLNLAVGGHPRPLRFTPDGRVEELGVPGLLVGAFESRLRPMAEVLLEPGDTVVLYTDGANDLPPPHGSSPEELAELMGRALKGTAGAEEAAEALSAALAERCPFVEREDDVALVVLRVGH